ncbi:MAG TPA: DUF1614 domain-containing protein [Firmicutes bacterium]|nr:DUF1614 domain-containing protein [Bacillota bacterium]
MPLGLILLFILAAIVYFGLAERVLDRLRLTDTQALIFLALMVAGSFITVTLLTAPFELTVNLGGAVVPVILAVYLLWRADSTWEWVRALLAAAGTAAGIWLIASLTDFDPPQADLFDPLWLYSLVGGVIAYLLGRSRRAAFVAGTLGVILADLGHLVQVWRRGLPSTVAIGGAGVFDAVIIAGIISVGLAELVGETRERLQGGPDLSEERPLALHQDEGTAEEGGNSRRQSENEEEGE